MKLVGYIMVQGISCDRDLTIYEDPERLMVRTRKQRGLKSAGSPSQRESD